MFTWSPSDMPGIDLNIICHRLHVNPACKPVAQKRRNFAPERVAIIEAEIDKLLAAGFIEEVSYSEWLANVVLVAKQEKGKWRVCVDYTDLSKACPKDNFPLPRIDQLVDSTSGNQLLSFMDAYSGYNQIMMHGDDKAKTSFIIERGTYCYKVMPFGLKNAGATYQRLVNKIFKEQIGKTMEVYVDDMLVKAPKRADHIGNLAESFNLLRQYCMKLNPSKCTFGVSSGILGIPSHATRYRGTPTSNQSHSRDEIALHGERNTKSDGQSSGPQPIPLEINQQVQTILQSFEERTKRQMG
ncbi:hypothetical protein L3X38_043183 [Prunus dulcis]|uniref:Reverse transcriptase domain-containing protein n=1 Tax=Prunus dulcis TaxID=3755 RepID=A0AAD4UXZ4_PRUDU|nr:hypothetical protein L3X38_043183 [Prunus dulcis]